jgi:flavin reductase (DIM6/NTAB) family NADH-FMN oxidoreductase RutF
MAKKTYGPQTWLFPYPTVLIGTVFEGKTDFAPYAWCGIAGGDPPAFSVSINNRRFTLRGLNQNHTFSVNIPSDDMVRETDYCGMVSGKDADKAKACKFKIFYGRLKTAPLIEQCPVNLECEVFQVLELGDHSLVIGKIVQSHVSESCLTEGKPDIMKIKPILYSMGTGPQYNAVGDILGRGFHIGKTLLRQP